MAAARYQLPDEPAPTLMARHAVDPLWPLLALMLGNNAFGLAWFAFNAFALGTPTRRREYACIALSVFGSAGLYLALVAMHDAGVLHTSALRYAALLLTALKLCVAYVLYLQQRRSFEIWEYYGGRPANGMPGLVVAFLAAQGLARLDAIPAVVLAVMR